MNDRPLLHDSPRPDTALLAGSALLAWALFLLRFGYGFGYSDQDEFLPLAMRLLDGQLFARDAFVLMQLDGFTIRMPMAWLVALPSMVLPLWLTVFLLHMGTGIASGWAVARMANRLTDRWWIPPLATVAVIAITARWNPGGNDILHGMLVPSSVAWCALLWAFVRWQGQRYLSAGLLTALGTLFHPLVGLQAGGVLMLSLFFDREARTKDRIRMLLPWLVVAAATILLFSDLGSSGGEGAASATTILTHWRAPHHYLPWTFRGADALQLVLLVAGAGLLLWRGPGTPGKDQADLSKARLLLLIPVALLVASLTLTWWPFSLDSVLRLQPWALSPLIRVWSTLLLVVLAAGFIPRRTALKADKQRFSPAFLMLLVGGAALSLVLVRLTPDIRGAAHPDRELHAWAAENTDINAVFVVPPSMTGFQTGAMRAQYVSFKSFPFAAEPTQAWWERLQRMAPVAEVEPGGVALQARLDSSWAHRSLADVRSFVTREPVDFLVRPAQDPARWSDAVQPQWCNQQWCVFWAGRILRTHPEPPRP